MHACGLKTGHWVRPGPLRIEQVEIPAAGLEAGKGDCVQTIGVPCHGHGVATGRYHPYSHAPDPWCPHAEAHRTVGVQRGSST